MHALDSKSAVGQFSNPPILWSHRYKELYEAKF